MQKLRIQSKWNKETNSFDRNIFELRESDKVISGKVSISSKKGDVYISKALPFVAFKSKIDDETQIALLHSNGELFEADFSLNVDSFAADQDDGSTKEVKYIKLVINKAVGDFKKVDAPVEVPVEDELDDDFPPF